MLQATLRSEYANPSHWSANRNPTRVKVKIQKMLAIL